MTDSMTTSCPTPEQLKGLVDGTLPDVEQTATQTHVDGCAACQQALESLVQGSESWDSALERLREEPAGTRETILSEAMKQMKAEEFVESADSGWQAKQPLDFLTPSDQPGSIGKLGSYEVTEVVGQGGMGIVVKAFDPALHRVVAVKVLAPYLAHNPQARKRFIKEAQAIAAVSHDHVITIHGIDESSEQPRIVMQFVAGRSLQQKIDAEGSLDLKEILRIGMQTAAGLAAAHAQGLVHRDVKPSNILLENGIQRVKLTDFGLARAVDDASLTQSGAIVGTPQYMAPEQANGDAVDYRADLFSLGSVMYAMCVGHSPFRASTTMGVLKRVCHDPPRPIQELNADIPDWLCAIVMKLLAKKPEDRFPNASSVAELLEKWLAHVQQPMVVARPALVAGVSSDAGTSRSAFVTDATRPAATEDRERFARRELDGRSILFQPISGRWFLFFVLLGTAVTLAFLRMESSRPSMGHPDLPEALVISVMGGLGTAVWGLVFIAVVRFVWANLYGYVPWVAKSPLTDGILDPADPKRNAISRLRPESLAVLAAIITMLFSFNPLIAAIVAVIVWNVSRSRSAKRELDGGTNPAYSASPVETMPKSNLLEKGFSSLSDLWRAGRDRIRPVFAFAGRLFGPTSTERNRLLLAIGWFVVGGIDLCFLLVFISILASHHTGNSSALFVMSLFGLVFSLISFAVSFCIQSRQNPSIVQSMSYVGLLPLSLGAIGRLPLGIATLFWLNAPGTRDSFEATPWAQTKLGGLLRHTLSFGRRSLGTTVWLMLWAIAWPLVVVAVVIFWVIPYGPSTYEIYDKSIVTLKGVPNKRFELIASGTGDIVGLSPPVQSYRCQQLGLGSVGGVRESQLTVPLPEYPASEKAMEDLTREIARGLYRLFNESYPKHAASLAQASQRLNVAERLGDTPMGDNRFQQKSLMERLRGFENSNRPVSTPWKGAVRFGSILDPELFQVELDTNFSHFDSHPSTILMVSGGIAAFLIWLVVSLWIIKRRHFSRIATKPAVVAVAT